MCFPFHFVRYFLSFLWFVSIAVGAAEPLYFEGYCNDPIEKKLYHMDRFLPYNPKIIGLGCSREGEETCRKHWPLATYAWEDPVEFRRGLQADLVWLDSDGAELYFLEMAVDLLKSARVVYTKTHFFHQGAFFQKLKQYLEILGYVLFSHWYQQDRDGEAIFVKRALVDASIRTLNYSPPENNSAFVKLSPRLEIEKYLSPAKNKSNLYRMDRIDFIYMINLDERPEKFALAAEELGRFGITPYRFSAVNGWKLNVETFNQLGVQFSPEMIQEKLMGTVYKEADGRAYMSNEYLQANGDVYFILGMSPGAIGIVLSHLSVLYDAYLAGYETIWVMEDDIEAIDDPNRLSELIQKLDLQVDQWDILFTDVDTKDSRGVHVPCRAMAARPNLNMQSFQSFYQRFYRVSDDFSRIGMRYGAYSMIVRRSGMKKILDYFKKYRIYLPYDFDLWMVPGIQLYSVNQDVVSHRPGAPSDNSYPFYIEK